MQAKWPQEVIVDNSSPTADRSAKLCANQLCLRNEFFSRSVLFSRCSVVVEFRPKLRPERRWEKRKRCGLGQLRLAPEDIPEGWQTASPREEFARSFQLVRRRFDGNGSFIIQADAREGLDGY